MSDVELPELSEVTLAIRNLINTAREFSARTARELGVNATDLDALALLEQHGPMGPAQLATRLGLRTASVTVVVDRLERAGHVQRVPDQADRRRVTVTTTPSAHRASLALLRPSILAVDEAGRALDPDAQRVVVDYLDRVIQTMRPDTPDQHR
ncbi:MarR family winged helix-turn-helix transcriptional regulator [Actinokineospora spheciospongiae]|uniref:MarR family winged helix-turn-helix transcriptional regulator n=1 Tax=Actinokineospora spheciospongiae TaxID=909613 RepID=UPI000D70AFAC|nr:MarR family transcriptional regulator [Actinokineospora spheciospongiae]PWW60291.1 DNA-binding MarR family transcriptional regulator [Actinokineospora spheciospongiae]